MADKFENMDATIVTRILEAGGTIIGRAACENMCHSATSHSSVTGPVHNPYARGYSSGGSSSGSAVLVANGDVDMAIGADQGGSIRVPAAWCGIYGLKPTFGLVPFTGCASNEPTNDHVGPMASTVLDNALLLQAIAGTDGIDDRSYGSPQPPDIPSYHQNLLDLPTPMDLSGIRIGVIEESLTMPGIDPRVKACFLDATERFKHLGAVVQNVCIPFHKHAGMIWMAMSKYNAYLTLIGAGGRRGHIMNDLNEKKWPMSQQAWEKAYPRFSLHPNIPSIKLLSLSAAPKTSSSTAYIPRSTSQAS
jgi:amidase